VSAANEPATSETARTSDVQRVIRAFYDGIVRHRVITGLLIALGFRNLDLLFWAPFFGGPPPARALQYPFERWVYFGVWIALLVALWAATARYLISSVGSGAAREQPGRALVAVKLTGALLFLAYFTYAVSIWVKSYAPTITLDSFGLDIFIGIAALAAALAGIFLLAFPADLLEQRVKIEVRLVRGKAADAG